MTESNNRIWQVNEKNGLWMSSPISRRQLFAGAGGVALLGDPGGLRRGSAESVRLDVGLQGWGPEAGRQLQAGSHRRRSG